MAEKVGEKEYISAPYRISKVGRKRGERGGGEENEEAVVRASCLVAQQIVSGHKI